MLKTLLLIAVEKHFLTFCNVGNFSGWELELAVDHTVLQLRVL